MQLVLHQRQSPRHSLRTLSLCDPVRFDYADRHNKRHCSTENHPAVHSSAFYTIREWKYGSQLMLGEQDNRDNLIFTK